MMFDEEVSARASNEILRSGKSILLEIMSFGLAVTGLIFIIIGFRHT